MENGRKEWGFNNKCKKEAEEKRMPMRQGLKIMHKTLNAIDHLHDDRQVIHLDGSDPSLFPCFRTSAILEDAVIHAVRSSQFNGYAPPLGLLPARKAIAEYMSKDIPFDLSANDIYLTVGVKQAIQAVVDSLAHPEANILLPRPGYPFYDDAAAYSKLEVRHYDLLQNKGWEIDLDSIQTLADDNTVAMVIINPGNPCENVYSYEHLERVAETARKLGLLVISDEVFDHITFGSNLFVRMGVFASKVPIFTLGSISKRWVVPGWRFGWLATCDSNGVLQNSQLLEQLDTFFHINATPPTFIQAAIPEIIEKTEGEFFSRVVDLLHCNADLTVEKLNEIPCITCPNKPEGAMFAMVEVDVSMLNDIQDDIDFSIKLAKEEKVFVVSGHWMGMKNWLRLTFALEASILEEGLERLKAFCQRHSTKKHGGLLEEQNAS